MVYFNSLGNVFKLIRFLKRDDLYSILILDEKYKQRFKSDYIYDAVEIIGKNVRCYQRQPYILVKQGENYGVFNPVTLSLVLPIQFSRIELREYHRHLIFIAQRKEVIEFEDESYEFYVNHIFDIFGNDLFGGQTFDELTYMGEYSDSEEYLFLATVLHKENPIEPITTKGIISLKGNVVFPFSEENGDIFKFHKRRDFLIVLFFGEMIEEEDEIGRKKEVENIRKITLLNSFGNIIEENLDYKSVFDYFHI